MSDRQALLQRVKRIVVKVGSTVLTAHEEGLDLAIISALAKDLSEVVRDGHEVIVVSSGAVAAGMKKLGLRERPRTIQAKQAAAAIGQSSLMWAYERSFVRHGRKVAQVLLTHDDLKDRRRYLNARNTLFMLVELGVIPVVNENDTVSVDELKFGDNDNLCALLTNVVGADLLIILTDTEGVYDRDPKHGGEPRHIPLVREVDLALERVAGGAGSPGSLGGMASKLQAVKKAAAFGVPAIIANGRTPGIVGQLLAGAELGTLFLPRAARLRSRKHWIFTLHPRGAIQVDEGARRAIVQQGRSLLPSGIVRLVNYSAKELELIKGLRTSQIEARLGYKHSDEVIHRDNLVLV
ncbi:MAG: glutamate 5-kinase [Deltaproteobacteria bacterium]|nr:glutamate 5-kinase [Deltaproteobacteria bacterium]